MPHKVEGLQEQLRQLPKENAELKEKAAAAAAGDIFKDVKESMVTVISLVKCLYQMQVPFVPLRTTGNKRLL